MRRLPLNGNARPVPFFKSLHYRLRNVEPPGQAHTARPATLDSCRFQGVLRDPEGELDGCVAAAPRDIKTHFDRGVYRRGWRRCHEIASHLRCGPGAGCRRRFQSRNPIYGVPSPLYDGYRVAGTGRTSATRVNILQIIVAGLRPVDRSFSLGNSESRVRDA
jgi:hypothetical protein